MSLITKIVQNAAAEPGLHYLNPPVPHGCVLPGGISIGSKIYFQGVCTLSSTRATFNLQRGSGDDTDIYLHLDARIPEQKVVRNTRLDGNWGSEEKDGGCPFVAGQPFLLVITAFSDNYEIEINGKPFSTFAHRDGLPPSNVTHFSLYGDFMLQAVHVPIQTMPKNLRLTIPGKVKVGEQFSIKGVPNDGASRIVMNWQCGPSQSDDVVFHFNPRFEGVVVRNTRAEEQWAANEEREGGFPFGPGVPFHIQVSVASDGFRVRVDGSELFKFAHRLDHRNAGVCLIEGDVQITDFQVDSPQGKLPHEENYRDFAGAALEVYYPPTPTVQAIPCDLSPGKFIVVSGKVDAEPSRMYINLQCADCEDSDCCLHVNPRFEESNFVVLNNKDGDWKDEVRVEDGPFSPGSPYEFVALVQEDGFELSTNGLPITKFPARMDFSRVHHLAVGGSASVSRILVL